MDPIKKMWMFHNWIADQTDDAELAKNHAYLLGSFWNPDAVRKLMGEGSGTVYTSSDAEFDQSTEMVERARIIDNNKPKRKRRKKIKG